MGTVDILRDCERGVPRYNNFRRGLHMPAFKTFEELIGGDEALAQKLSDAEGGNIEAVDALVGSHSEPVPKGFRFQRYGVQGVHPHGEQEVEERSLYCYAVECGDVYDGGVGAWGMGHVQNTTMKDVLVRQFPELEPVLMGQKNVFAPWRQLPRSR
jgi:hypothetical protein